jgi:integrase
VCGLQVTDIKRFNRPPLDRPTVWAEVTIQHTNTRSDGFRRRTKTGETRVVPVGKQTFAAFDRVERYWQAVRYANGTGHASYKAEAVRWRIQHYFEKSEAPLERRRHGPVFVNLSGTMLNSASVGAQMWQLVLRAGLFERDDEGRILIEDGKPKPRISLYSFRHMVATHNANHLPTHIGAAVTGHNEQTYLSTYVHQSAEDQVLIAKSLGGLESELEELAEPPATNLQQRLLTG